MLHKDQLDEIVAKINFLKTRDTAVVECSRLNPASDFNKKKDYTEIVGLYKFLIDNDYPCHSAVVKTIEDHLLTDEAVSIDPKYLNENADCANKEKHELLKNLAHSIYYGGDCDDEMLDAEESASASYSFGSEVIFRSNKALPLLAKANELLETAEVHCLMGEIFFNATAFEDAEASFRSALKVDKTYSKTYALISQLFELKHGKESALSFLADTLDNNIDSLEIRINSLRLCHALAVEAKQKNDDATFQNYVARGREHAGILKDKFSYDLASIFSDQDAE